MTKQEGIREGVREIIIDGMINDHRTLDITDDVLEYLDKNGVVVKVRCPCCAWSQFGEEPAGMTPCNYCNSAGYIIEPLIEEVK